MFTLAVYYSRKPLILTLQDLCRPLKSSILSFTATLFCLFSFAYQDTGAVGYATAEGIQSALGGDEMRDVRREGAHRKRKAHDEQPDERCPPSPATKYPAEPYDQRRSQVHDAHSASTDHGNVWRVCERLMSAIVILEDSEGEGEPYESVSEFLPSKKDNIITDPKPALR